MRCVDIPYHIYARSAIAALIKRRCCCSLLSLSGWRYSPPAPPNASRRLAHLTHITPLFLLSSSHSHHIYISSSLFIFFIFLRIFFHRTDGTSEQYLPRGVWSGAWPGWWSDRAGWRCCVGGRATLAWLQAERERETAWKVCQPGCFSVTLSDIELYVRRRYYYHDMHTHLTLTTSALLTHMSLLSCCPHATVLYFITTSNICSLWHFVIFCWPT